MANTDDLKLDAVAGSPPSLEGRTWDQQQIYKNMYESIFGEGSYNEGWIDNRGINLEGSNIAEFREELAGTIAANETAAGWLRVGLWAGAAGIVILIGKSLLK